MLFAGYFMEPLKKTHKKLLMDLGDGSTLLPIRQISFQEDLVQIILDPTQCSGIDQISFPKRQLSLVMNLTLHLLKSTYKNLKRLFSPETALTLTTNDTIIDSIFGLFKTKSYFKF
ncbi:hypothetical protein TNCT_220271 [Trichonephila clavata]|uniref:Uncharacterized protein n=1 Tax=Trichonephila clavata TaxID=2740835 RepID=A0A8X6FTJ7_TRICU|nr:hypothetical protein TNCT_220271 [Trichonephila clavata]